MNKVIGYSRKSTSKQSNADGVEALKQAGCEIVFEEIVSTRKAEKDRPELMKCLASLRKGDTLKLTSLSRLGRTQREVINRLHELQAEGVNVITLDGLINTEALGKFAPVLIGLLTGLNHVERELTQERTLQSVEYRRKTGGNLGGRPKTSSKKEKLVLRLREEGDSLRSIQEQTGVAVKTIRRIIADNEKVAVGIK
jgi:DNA invertase Pin-like site-specific DNA recombinase